MLREPPVFKQYLNDSDVPPVDVCSLFLCNYFCFVFAFGKF